ncbi:MAG: xanthine dehydrogenase family protein [Deltaproteobacteria bacterium]|nr:xanthine dehydrogenase family protein [Deltaproteobacteria bacterium]MBW2077375.1 xanthine dehydrogenase family protein [Deltaproteobacteria bacterium]
MKSVGKNLERRGAKEAVLGKAVYADDIRLDSVIHLKVVRSTRPHALIKGIDASAAESIPGVIRIFTYKDIKGPNRYGIITKDQEILAERKVRYVGDPVALVAAESEAIAEKAAGAVKIEYEDLVPCFTIEEAKESTTEPIHENGNLLSSRDIIKGDVEEGFAEADIVVEETYTTSMVAHGYLETETGMGRLDEEGRIVISVCTQNPHYDQRDVAAALGLEPDQIRVVQSATGAGFGGKLDISVQGLIALAVQELQSPVKLCYSMEETMQSAAKRHAVVMHYKTGAKRNGRITAVDVKFTLDTGAYASYGLAVLSRAATHAVGPYEVPHVKIHGEVYYTNKVWAGAMRGFGVPQVCLAHEGQMDSLAQTLEMDPFEIRMINALKPGSMTSTGQVLNASVGIRETLTKIEQAKERREKNRDQGSGEVYPWVKTGWGIASFFYGIGNTGLPNPATARMVVDENSQITLYTGAAEIGQGSDTVLTQIAAEALGVSEKEIKLVRADTGLTTDAGATSASRQTYISGNAVKSAAEDLLQVLKEAASSRLHASPKEIRYEGKEFRAGEKVVTLEELAGELFQRGQIPMGEGRFDPPITSLDKETGQGTPYATYTFGTYYAEVEVDTRTAEVSVEHVIAAADLGKAINPSNVAGQIIGGVAMGIGYALMEEFQPGKTKNFADYLYPTSMDVPPVEVIIVEDPEPTGPYGAKGVGEPALIPTAPAIVSAINKALKIKIVDLPAKLERVMKLAGGGSSSGAVG